MQRKWWGTKNARFTLQPSNKIVQADTLFLTLSAFFLNLISIRGRYTGLAVASGDGMGVVHYPHLVLQEPPPDFQTLRRPCHTYKSVVKKQLTVAKKIPRKSCSEQVLKYAQEHNVRTKNS